MKLVSRSLTSITNASSGASMNKTAHSASSQSGMTKRNRISIMTMILGRRVARESSRELG